MTYLESLTLRLAAGIDRMDEAMRQRHSAFLKALQNVDGGFSGREGASDLYYTGFALRGLAMLGELDGPPAERAAEFLKGRLTSRAPVVDFLSLLYGAALLESSAGIDVFVASPPAWPDAVAATLESFRRPDGGYAKTDEGQSSSTYYSFLVVLCQQLIARATPQPERLAEFVRSRQREDGGFVEVGPMKRSGTNPTAAAIGLLTLLGGLDDPIREKTVDFLAQMQSDEGGFLANTRIPVADVLSTFTGALTLTDLNALDEIDVAAARRYVESMQLPGGGFRGGEWDAGTDVEYTFYGLGAWSLLSGT